MENLTYEWEDLFQFTEEQIIEDELQHIIIDMIKALGKMSLLNLHYFDIKSDNLESRNIKFIDFESVFYEKDKTNNNLVGSMGFISPECLQQKTYNILKGFCVIIRTNQNNKNDDRETLLKV